MPQQKVLFFATPLAPPCTRVVAHISPNQRINMAPHGVDECFVGPYLHHYRCNTCYILSTHGVQYIMTINWLPSTVPLPKVSTYDYLRKTSEDMLGILQYKETTRLPSLTHEYPITNEFIQISQILQRAAPPHTITKPCHPTEGDDTSATKNTHPTRTKGDDSITTTTTKPTRHISLQCNPT